MTIQEFKISLQDNNPPISISIQLESLWWVGKGDWHKAHNLIDHLSDPISAHIHAHLHRVEGDLWNARYWYNRAQQPEYKGDLDDEWNYLLELYIN